MSNKLKHLPPITDEEEVDIQREIAGNPDAPEITPEQAAKAMPFTEAFPELAAAMRRGRGRPASGAAKEAVTLRIDRATLERFKAVGPDWRTRMSEILEKAGR